MAGLAAARGVSRHDTNTQAAQAQAFSERRGWLPRGLRRHGTNTAQALRVAGLVAARDLSRHGTNTEAAQAFSERCGSLRRAA